MLLKIYFYMYKYIVFIVKSAEGSSEDEFRVLAEWRPEARVHGELDITVVSSGLLDTRNTR